MTISLCLALASFAFSFAGFGFSLLAVPLLALLLPIKTAVALQLPFSALLVLINALRYGRTLPWQSLMPLFIGAAVAIPLGVIALDRMPEILMKRTLALLIVTAVILARTRNGSLLLGRFADSRTGGAVMGGISGWFIGAYTAGGPPAVIYATARFPDEKKAKGVIGIFFSLSYLFVITLFFSTGIMNAGTLSHSLIHTPAVLIGFIMGGLLVKKVSHDGYMAAVHGLLLMAAFMLWIRHTA